MLDKILFRKVLLHLFELAPSQFKALGTVTAKMRWNEWQHFVSVRSTSESY